MQCELMHCSIVCNIRTHIVTVCYVMNAVPLHKQSQKPFQTNIKFLKMTAHAALSKAYLIQIPCKSCIQHNVQQQHLKHSCSAERVLAVDSQGSVFDVVMNSEI